MSTEFHVLSTPEEIAAAATAIAGGSGPIAVDAERASGYRYSQRAYLIQIFRRGSGTFLIDAPLVEDFAPVRSALAGEEWVFHAASQDLACLRELDLEPERIFDTELASRLLGKERVGLGAVVLETLGIELAKAHSAADWSKRPLPQEWLEYAALDVELLIDVRDVLDRELHEAGKREIAEQEFAAVLTKAPKPLDPEPWRRLTGLHAIKDPRRLAIARELWLARDALAREVDTSPGRLVPDSALVAVAQAMPTSRGALVATAGFHGRASRSEIDRWWDAVERGRHTDAVPAKRAPQSDAIPQPRNWAQKNPEADERLKLAKAAVAELALVMRLPTENLLTPEVLRRVCWNPPGFDASDVADALRALGAREWQIDACAEPMSEAFVQAHQIVTDASEVLS
ncbi:MAG TPA: ribonuclease D [Microbacteriaceae bacterium]|nr:ribonuclease D [Microbacteriaceae bacterium]